MAASKVLLHHQELEGLVYGQDLESSIVFGVRGGNAPGYALVDEDHPLLAQLLEAEPVDIVDDTPMSRVYVCPVCDKEIKTKPALKAHLSTHGAEVVEDTTEE